MKEPADADLAADEMSDWSMVLACGDGLPGQAAKRR
jgi:hypothetical protein